MWKLRGGAAGKGRRQGPGRRRCFSGGGASRVGIGGGTTPGKWGVGDERLGRGGRREAERRAGRQHGGVRRGRSGRLAGEREGGTEW